MFKSMIEKIKRFVGLEKQSEQADSESLLTQLCNELYLNEFDENGNLKERPFGSSLYLANHPDYNHDGATEYDKDFSYQVKKVRQDNPNVPPESVRY